MRGTDGRRVCRGPAYAPTDAQYDGPAAATALSKAIDR